MQSNRPLAVCPSTLASIPFGLALCSMSFAAQPPTETPSDVQKLLEKNAPLVKDAEESSVQRLALHRKLLNRMRSNSMSSPNRISPVQQTLAAQSHCE